MLRRILRLPSAQCRGSGMDVSGHLPICLVPRDLCRILKLSLYRGLCPRAHKPLEIMGNLRVSVHICSPGERVSEYPQGSVSWVLGMHWTFGRSSGTLGICLWGLGLSCRHLALLTWATSALCWIPLHLPPGPRPGPPLTLPILIVHLLFIGVLEGLAVATVSAEASGQSLLCWARSAPTSAQMPFRGCVRAPSTFSPSPGRPAPALGKSPSSGSQPS